MNARKLLSAAKAVEAAYIEDVFSTYLYTGNGSTQTITNGVDLAGKGGLVWTKRRDNVGSHKLIDSARGWTVGSGVGQSSPVLNSDTTNAQAVSTSGTGGPYDITSVSSTGYTIGPDWNGNGNTNTATYVSWTFRKQAKFFDVVTYTGTSSPRSVSHNLGSAPGMVIVKRYDSTGQWAVWHRSGNQTNGKYGAYLNATDAYTDQATNLWGSETTPPVMTATEFNVGTDGAVNSNGFSYVAYLFAHDAGGFGASGSDNVISCGSFTTDGSGNATVTLGYEPQWIVVKRSDGVGSWLMHDNMRGLSQSTYAELYAQSSSAEAAGTGTFFRQTATGFVSAAGYLSNSSTYIYIAIRRGPMKTPTTGTSVYTGVTRSGTGTSATISAGFVVDWWHCFNRGAGSPQSVSDRLRGSIKRFETNSTAAEDSTGTDVIFSSSQLGIVTSTLTGVNYNASGNTYIDHLFARAPGFFDVVCYTGNSTAGRTIQHNLGAVPELIIVKARNLAENWYVYSTPLGNTKSVQLNQTNAQNAGSVTYWNSTNPTSSVFTLGANAEVNGAYDYVAYLFATCPGVSKVGSYTGTGSTLQIDCGFTGGARFVLIKRTDSTGDWYVWDSARGIVAGNDPHLSLNSTAAEVTTDDSVDTDSTGFVVNQLAATNVNVNAATYIFLAIA